VKSDTPPAPSPPAPLAIPLVRWSLVWLLATPLFAFFGALISMGDPTTITSMMVLPLAASFGCSVAAFISGRRLAMLLPAALVLVAAVALGLGSWQRAHPGPLLIPADEVTVAVQSVNGECRVTSLSAVAAGTHMVSFGSGEGGTLTIRGPQPSADLVYSYRTPPFSDGLGDPVFLPEGTYSVTCTEDGLSAETTLIVGP
jgi:hypothetical protein